MTRKVYRSMMGKVVDMELLSKANELTPAIGNAKVNARGDELGPGGKIVRKREDIVAEYYNSTPNAVKDEQFKRDSLPETNSSSVEISKDIAKKAVVKKEVKVTNEENKSNS